MDAKHQPRRKIILTLLLIFVSILLVVGWSLNSFNLQFIHPENAQETILLLALSTFIVVAFVIFGFILLRILLKLHLERRRQQLGSQFKVKMVVAFLGLSLLPVCVLFVFCYGLLNRSLDKWFGIPFDTVRRDAQAISQQLAVEAEQRSLDDASHLASDAQITRGIRLKDSAALPGSLAQRSGDLGLVSAMICTPDGRLVARTGGAGPASADVIRLFPRLTSAAPAVQGEATRWQSQGTEYFVGAQAVNDDAGKPLAIVVSARQLPLDLQKRVDQIELEARRYDALNRQIKAVKRIDLSALGLFTLVTLFSATWYAMFVSKQVTVPIQALAEATDQVSRGNLGYQVQARADGELGRLIQSFNEMTSQTAESRRVIDRAAQALQHANRELEERSNVMRAILENIPTGVVSADARGRINEVNSTAQTLLGEERVASAEQLGDLFSAEDAREVARLLRRAARQGVVSRQMELDLGARRATVALTVSSIRIRQEAAGFVVMIEDLTELLRAQRAAAWREVAQRLAHEIKNPLTPIQLSADRIRRLVERAGPGAAAPELASAVAESATLIGREAAALKALVDEFAAFARFPVSQPVPSALNGIIEEALGVFDGRLNGIRLHRELAADLPRVQADPEQIKRVVVNLIDNAAEALEHSPLREIWVRTALDPDREMVELTVADSGPGVSPEVKEKLFVPYFSTKRRGTGLGLAIVSRIVSEHHGYIRVEENRPFGTMFIIELPVERVVGAELSRV
ncbi:MAG TPA: ATP-binding protein [Terriglobia bacterium]|jgi:two-component system nitrogen regulation sensor histidine kinase NtrY|nr:ATP-binding protein [Terriglobia bacterium]